MFRRKPRTVFPGYIEFQTCALMTRTFLFSKSTQRIGLHVSIVAVALALTVACASDILRAARFVEDARGCDWFGYIRQAGLFRDRGVTGGLDTAISDDRTLYLIDVAKSLGEPSRSWAHGIAPQCHHYKPSVDRIVLQYPPGTGFVHSWLPDGTQARWAFVGGAAVVLLILLGPTVNARTTTVPLVTAALGAFFFHGMYKFVHDRSILPSAVAALVLGWLTVASANASTPPRRMLLIGMLGLASGLSASFRLTNVFLVAGPLIVAAFTFVRRPGWPTLAPIAVLGGTVLIGLTPVFMANAINAGHPLLTTYDEGDASWPSLTIDVLRGGFAFYFLEHRTSALYVLVPACLLVAILIGPPFRTFRGAIQAAAMGMLSLLVSVAYLVTHVIYNSYYLFPPAAYAAAVAGFCLIACENARVRVQSLLRTALLFRIALTLAVFGTIAMFATQLSMPLSPHYEGRHSTFAIDSRAVIWANTNAGNITYFLHRQAAALPFLAPPLQARFVETIARNGVPQYVLLEDTLMWEALERLRERHKIKFVGTIFGFDTALIEPSRASGQESEAPRQSD